MPWKVEFNGELGFIHTVHHGLYTRQESMDALKEALALAQGDGPHLFLTDLLDAESKLSTVDLYKRPTLWEDMGANRENKLAILVSKEGQMWEDAKFFETTCRNQGWQVAVFSQRREAIDWLTGRRGSDETRAGDVAASDSQHQT